MSAALPDRPKKHRPARPWRRRVIVGALVAVNLVAIATWLGLRSLGLKLDAELNRNEAVVAELSPQETSGQPTTFLVIGSDSREKLPDDLAGSFGSFAGQRADAVMLVQTFPEGRAQILSVPRDLRVDVESYGTNRINAAYSFGGAPLMVKTTRDATRLPIHHYVELDFAGFARIVDELGGVPMDFPYAARDLKSGLQVRAGTTELDGAMALAYARSRKYQEYRDGAWRSVDGGDLGRTHRQQQLVFAILSELKRPSTLLEAGSLIEAIGPHLTIDSALTDSAMIRLAWDMRGISSSDIEAVTLPTTGVSEGGRSYQVPAEPEATAVLAAFGEGRSLVALSEGPLKLQVLNGNGSPGAAAELAGSLEILGFVIVDVSDADSFDFAETVVMAPVDRLTKAEPVAEALGVSHISAGSVPGGVDAVVIIGHDLKA